jgi:hypothetical protein
VSYHIIHSQSSEALIADSYHLMIVGSSLQSLSLFTLSCAKPDQFYLVSGTATPSMSHLNVLGFYGSRCPRWDRAGPDICSQHSCHLSALLQKTHIGNVSRGVWHITWCSCTSDHAQSPVERPCWLFERRHCQCRLCQCFVADRLLMYAH